MATTATSRLAPTRPAARRSSVAAAAPTAPVAVELREIASSTAHRVDREAGIIRRVKVLGTKSRHGYEYSVAAMASAAHLYEGARVNLNHKQSPGDRDVNDRFGELRNVRAEADGIYADLHFIKGHPRAEMICEAAERMPRTIGLSQHAAGRKVMRGGRQIVEAITAVHSVDLVADPATTNGLFESSGLSGSPTGRPPAPRASVSAAPPADRAALQAEIERLRRKDDVRTVLFLLHESMAEAGPDKPAAAQSSYSSLTLPTVREVERLVSRYADAVRRVIEDWRGNRLTKEQALEHIGRLLDEAEQAEAWALGADGAASRPARAESGDIASDARESFGGFDQGFGFSSFAHPPRFAEPPHESFVELFEGSSGHREANRRRQESLNESFAAGQQSRREAFVRWLRN